VTGSPAEPGSAAAAAGSGISVIVPTFNRAAYIGACLRSLLAQTVPALEIIVVDDGSDDDTAERVAAFGPAVRYLRKDNGGKSTAVNRGLREARGDLVWIADDDDVALPEANALRLRALAANPGAGFVYAAHRLARDGPPGADGLPGIVPGALVAPPAPPADAFFLEIMRSCFFHLGSALVPRALYERLGGFDEALLRGQDYDFQIRLARVARPAWCPEPVFLFRQHDGPRGARAIRAGAATRGEVFRRFSQGIGLKLRREVTLPEYLTPPRTGAAAAAALPRSQQAEALLNRAQVMGNHGCVAEMLEDIEALLLLRAAAGTALTAHDAARIDAAMRTGWAYEASAQDWAGFEAGVARLSQRPGGRQAARALATGVFRLARGYPDAWRRRWAKLLHATRLARHALP
jgi:hypothetical protein